MLTEQKDRCKKEEEKEGGGERRRKSGELAETSRAGKRHIEREKEKERERERERERESDPFHEGEKGTKREEAKKENESWGYKGTKDP